MYIAYSNSLSSPIVTSSLENNWITVPLTSSYIKELKNKPGKSRTPKKKKVKDKKRYVYV